MLLRNWKPNQGRSHKCHTVSLNIQNVHEERKNLRDYMGWAAAERLASLKKTKAAIAAGIIPSPTQCNRCGKTTGRIDYHNHDYSDPIKYLEQICQGCHIRLHRMENKELASQKSNGHVSTAIKEEVPKIPVPKEPKVINTNPPVIGTREEMHKIRINFTKALGLDWSENPNPNSGFKYEHNLTRRQQYLDDARRLRNLYAEMVTKTATHKDILVKMVRNLENRDRGVMW